MELGSIDAIYTLLGNGGTNGELEIRKSTLLKLFFGHIVFKLLYVLAYLSKTSYLRIYQIFKNVRAINLKRPIQLS